MAKALALLSGGLDSTLAIRVIQEQGIEVEALNFVTAFCRCTNNDSCKLEAKHAAEVLGIPVRVINSTEALLEIVKNPKHGYGSNMNPCIDCRIHLFREAGKYLRQVGSDFLVTGEVLGQRPMSQRRHAMEVIDREADVVGLVLRPLCAKHLPPTFPEKQGLVDRSKLLGIQGRSRKPQIALADIFQIKDYPCPAGGCLLTDPGFSTRLRDLLKHDPAAGINDVHLLKLGRHFRLDERTKVIVGREEWENPKIATFARDTDRLLEPADEPGPTVLLRGDLGGRNTLLAAGFAVRYSKSRNRPQVNVMMRQPGSVAGTVIVAAAPDDATIDLAAINAPDGRAAHPAG